MRLLARLLCATVLVLPGVPASGQSSGCVAPEHRAFDFWLGRWQVLLADGTFAGHNEIAAEQGGCVLIERWNGAQGGTGVSQNFYDVGSGQWRQLWISPGTQIDIRGAASEGEMVLEGTISYVEPGKTFPFRGRWTLLDDGRVRQFFEEAREPGVWKEWFEGFYVPQDQ
jgi:hypothetical protein